MFIVKTIDIVIKKYLSKPLRDIGNSIVFQDTINATKHAIVIIDPNNPIKGVPK
jgi:hypothetical protein